MNQSQRFGLKQTYSPGSLSAEYSAFKKQYAVWPLSLFTMLLFCQVWGTVAGYTIRAEDVFALLLLGWLFLPVVRTGKLRYFHNPLNLPLLVWCVILLLGVGITLLSPFDSTTKKDALVNGIRLILAVGMFLVFLQNPAPTQKKLRVLLVAVIGFSFLTTAVALLQMGYWDGWLPVRLPSVLTTFKEGANTETGREIFALYLGNTGSHTWSGALAIQALLIWLVGRNTKGFLLKVACWFYFGLLIFILIRISVRNSTLGLFVAIMLLELFRAQEKRDLLKFILGFSATIMAVVLLLYVLFYFAPDTYFFERIRQAIPQFENGELVINRGSNIYGRLDYWDDALKMFASSPITGKGFYTYQAISFGTHYYIPTVHAHNSYLQTLAELGIVGAIALGWLLLRIRNYLNNSRSYFKPNTYGKIWWEFTTGIFIFLIFTAIFSNTFWNPNYVCLLMMALGVLASLFLESD